MKYASLTLIWLIAFCALTTPTIFHLGPVGIFWTKVGYNILSLVFWLGFFYLLRKYWRSEYRKVSGFFSFAWRWLSATILTLSVFVLTLRAKLLAYGPYWSCPDRPMFAFGWPFPWKWETAGGPNPILWILPLNLICCFGLMLFLLGFRRLKHFLIAFLIPPLLFIGYLIADGSAGEIYDILTSRHLRSASETTEVQQNSTSRNR